MMKTAYKIKSITLFAICIFATTSILNANTTKTSDKTFVKTTEMSVELDTDNTLENWMADLALWSYSSKAVEESYESDIEVEEWMLKANTSEWNVENDMVIEEELEVEDWMVNLKKW